MRIEIEGHGTLTGNMDVMNYLSIVFSKAEEMFRLDGATALSEQAGRIADDIYNELKRKNYYGA